MKMGNQNSKTDTVPATQMSHDPVQVIFTEEVYRRWLDHINRANTSFLGQGQQNEGKLKMNDDATDETSGEEGSQLEKTLRAAKFMQSTLLREDPGTKESDINDLADNADVETLSVATKQDFQNKLFQKLNKEKEDEIRKKHVELDILLKGLDNLSHSTEVATVSNKYKCGDFHKAVYDCYKLHASEPLKCTELVSNFAKCVKQTSF